MRLRWRTPMPKRSIISRRTFISGVGSLGATLLGGCDQITQSKTARKIFGSAETVNIAVQRALGRRALAAEFQEADLSPAFRPNGSTDPDSELYDDISKDN